MQVITKSPKDITKESYQATAKEFARHVANLAPLESIERFIAMLPPAAKIVDVGCGSGRDADIFTKKGLDVLGIDFCPNLLDIAIKHAPLAAFELMDIEKMDFPTDSFDGVWAACSLLHIAKADLPKVLKQLHLLLKEGGCFYLTVKKGEGEVLERDARYEGNHQKFWSFFEEAELTDFLQAAQFKILDFSVVEKKYPYQTQDACRVFCQKYFSI